MPHGSGSTSGGFCTKPPLLCAVPCPIGTPGFTHNPGELEKEHDTLILDGEREKEWQPSFLLRERSQHRVISSS